MWFLQLLVLFAIVSVGPGLFFVRRWRLSPPEKLVASVGLSFLLVYAGAFAVFVTGPQATELANSGAGAEQAANDVAAIHSKRQLLVTGACLLLTLLSFHDLRRLLTHRQVRRMLLAFGAFLAWGLVLLSLVRGYGGGTWSGDWLEHYERSNYFLGIFPRDFRFIDLFPLPSRPPMMNVLAAHFMGQAGTEFDRFQVVFLFLNSLVLLPCCLIAGDLLHPTARWARRLPWTVLLLLAASPMVCQNLTYTWTKLFTMFYVLLALHLYLRAWRKARRDGASRDRQGAASPLPDGRGSHKRPRGGSGSSPGAPARDPARLRFVLAFAALCAGFLTHYSAGPYALFVGLHYLLFVWWRRKHRFAEAALIAAVSGLILASWFAWSVRVYGPRTTFASNSTVTDSAPMSAGENVLNIGKNLLDTLLPTALRRPSILTSDKDLAQPTTAGRVRDFAFLNYQVSVTLGLGSAGLLLVGYLLWRFLLRPLFFATPADPPPDGPGLDLREGRFWVALAPFVFVVGVTVYGGKDRFGVAHICLQGLVLLGLCLLAAGWRRIPSPFRWVLLPGLLLDYGLGIFLHFTLENRDFPMTHDVNHANQWVMLPTPDVLSRAAQSNWWTKVNGLLTFWGDHCADIAWLFQAASVALLAWFAWQALRPPAAGALLKTGTSRGRSPAVNSQAPGRARQARSRGAKVKRT